MFQVVIAVFIVWKKVVIVILHELSKVTIVVLLGLFCEKINSVMVELLKRVINPTFSEFCFSRKNKKCLIKVAR